MKNDQHTVTVDLPNGMNVTASRMKLAPMKYGWNGMLRGSNGLMIREYKQWPSSKSIVKDARAVAEGKPVKVTVYQEYR